MIQTRELFPDSLDHALLANRVSMALHQIQRKEEPTDQAALDEALKFLQFIREGREFTHQLTVSEHSYQAALAYGEAIRAIGTLSVQGQAMEEGVDKLLKWLVNVTESLRDVKPVKNEDVSTLDRFFNLIAEAALASTTSPVERVEYLY